MRMRLFSRSQNLNLFIRVYSRFHEKSKPSNVLIRKFNFLSTHQKSYRYPTTFSSLICVYSSDNKKLVEKKADVIKDVIEQRKEQLKHTEHIIRQKGVELVRDLKHQKELTGQKFRDKRDNIIKDILETKAKVKGTLGVIERENVFTIPNILCITRIAMSPYLGYVILQEHYNLALGLLAFAGFTDLLDGWIARTWKGQSSKMGSFLDPMADKVLIATLFVALTWQDLIPLALTLLIISRDTILVAAGFVIRYRSLPPPYLISLQKGLGFFHSWVSVVFFPYSVYEWVFLESPFFGLLCNFHATHCLVWDHKRTLGRYFDPTHATAQLAPTFISKVNTAIQLTLVGTALASPVFGFVDHPALQALCGVTAATTVASAISYLVSKDTYKYLKRK